MLAYSGIAQAGFMLAPFVVLRREAVADIVPAVVIYLVIYAAMNLGAFAVVIAVARKTALGRDRQLRRPVHARRPASPSR